MKEISERPDFKKHDKDDESSYLGFEFRIEWVKKVIRDRRTNFVRHSEIINTDKNKVMIMVSDSNDTKLRKRVIMPRFGCQKRTILILVLTRHLNNYISGSS